MSRRNSSHKAACKIRVKKEEPAISHKLSGKHIIFRYNPLHRGNALRIPGNVGRRTCYSTASAVRGREFPHRTL